MCEHGGYPDFCKHCTTQRIAELDERLRVQDLWRRELEQRVKVLEDALQDAIDGYEECAQYKGDYLFNKHGDAEEIARLKAALEKK